MDLATLTVFLPACFALNMAPGPNNLLSVSNATRYGFRRACTAGIGRILAFAGMIALAGAGLSVVLQTSEWLFHAIKIIGAAYLLYLAWQLWRANPEAEQQVTGATVGFFALARQEFLVAAGNPKAISAVHRVSAAVRRPGAAGAGAIRGAGRAVPAAGVDRHQRLRVDGPAHAPLVRRAARQADLQSLLRGPAVGGGFGVVDGETRLSLGRAFEFDLIAVRVEAVQRQPFALGAEA
jgi:threonine/homoserine/homoserine lactone efflux protein